MCNSSNKKDANAICALRLTRMHKMKVFAGSRAEADTGDGEGDDEAGNLPEQADSGEGRGWFIDAQRAIPDWLPTPEELYGV